LDAIEQEARAAADFEDIEASSEALHEIDLELIDEVVVAARLFSASAGVVAPCELVVVGARRFEIIGVGVGAALRVAHRGSF
jgi:hypothetical protein